MYIRNDNKRDWYRPRPRERLKSKRIDSLNDSEVLALLLETGTNGENVIDLSHRLIQKYNFSNEKII